MPDLENLSPEEMQRLMREMQKKEYEGLTPEEAEEKKRRKEAEKQRNLAVLEETEKIFRDGTYAAEGLSDVTVFLPACVKALREEPVESVCDTTYGCVNADSLSIARDKTSDEKRCLVLNLASSSRPGGAIREGANGQEESLCRKSSLLLSLESEKAGAYYDCGKSLNTRLGTDAVMISPSVLVIRDGGDELLAEPFRIAVMSCSAPMVRLGFEGKTTEEYEEMLFGRIEGMLRCAAHLGYRRLVLGAFGCGAFGNDAATVARAFDKALRGPLNGAFESVDFAILCKDGDDYNFKRFSELFGE
ncbi:MAG: TIGR02452 family protein [Clostridia bacterium]|nr:TIGR02452 family protein [Clostridia bacterium]